MYFESLSMCFKPPRRGYLPIKDKKCRLRRPVVCFYCIALLQVVFNEECTFTLVCTFLCIRVCVCVCVCVIMISNHVCLSVCTFTCTPSYQSTPPLPYVVWHLPLYIARSVNHVMIQQMLKFIGFLIEMVTLS